ncbi:MAG: site-specific integrase [Candidatus Rokubacteria bacterium]|nr:site-specific integrase [Candidatus Rokubacteria bacterium]MBI3109288.1 site-specific integrase [Candidatus Rokubacteria bacterium]
MAKVKKRVWYSRGPTGHKVRKVSWGYTLQVDDKQERIFRAEWTEDDAEQALAKRLLERDRPKAKPIALGEAAERYEQAKARKQSLGGDKLILKRLLAHFGRERRLDKITAEAISLYRDGRLSIPSERRKDAEGKRRPLGVATVNRELALLRHLLRLAHEEWGALAAVPRIRLGKEPEGRIRWLEPGEEGELLAACQKSRNPNLVKIVTVALETGMRYGEVLGLTWDRVDLSRGVLRLERTKSGKRREVPMRQPVYNLLAAMPEPREGRLWPDKLIRTAFENAVSEAKLEDFRFHDCRHHFASWFMMRGGSLQALQKILGHATLAMTSRYAHLSPSYLRSEMERTATPTEASVSTQSAHEAAPAAVAVEK